MPCVRVRARGRRACACVCARASGCECGEAVQWKAQPHTQRTGGTAPPVCLRWQGESLQLVEDKLKNPILDYVQNILFSAPNYVFPADGTP